MISKGYIWILEGRSKINKNDSKGLEVTDSWGICTFCSNLKSKFFLTFLQQFLTTTSTSQAISSLYVVISCSYGWLPLGHKVCTCARICTHYKWMKRTNLQCAWYAVMQDVGRDTLHFQQHNISTYVAHHTTQYVYEISR